MSFARVLNLHRQLRLELLRHAGDEAMPPLEGLSLPTGEDDELSFVRLVVWSYALLQENGRVSLKFLRELGKSPKEEVVERVMALRAWLTHNLSLTKDSERLNIARAWLRKSCGAHLDLKPEHWKQCFLALTNEMCEFLQRALASCAVLEDPTDGPHNVLELRRRLSKNWDAYQFDRYVEEAAARLGLDNVDIVGFRTRHLNQWRKVVELAEDGNTARLLTLRVETDLVKWFGETLPLTATEVLEHIPLEPRALCALLLVLRRGRPGSAEELKGLLANLRASLPLEDPTPAS